MCRLLSASQQTLRSSVCLREHSCEVSSKGLARGQSKVFLPTSSAARGWSGCSGPLATGQIRVFLPSPVVVGVSRNWMMREGWPL